MSTLSKLTQEEWISVETPLPTHENNILRQLINGYHDISIQISGYESILSFLKLHNDKDNDHDNDHDNDLDKYLFDIFFQPLLHSSIKSASSSKKRKPNIKKATMIRIESSLQILEGIEVRANIYEYVLLDLFLPLRSATTIDVEWYQRYYAFTQLLQLKNTVAKSNKTCMEILLQNSFSSAVQIRDVILQGNAVFECNPFLRSQRLREFRLYQHQKDIFRIFNDPEERGRDHLIFYLAPTGTGKTLTPVALSENKRVIFICGARHVSLAFARSAISIGKKIAFAFGCKATEDIRLHHFAATDFTVNKKTGGIFKVDNTNGRKVEIMISDLESYEYAMYYMQAFFDVDDILLYWDEPTIGLDSVLHLPIHDAVTKVWRANTLRHIVLSSATLPTEKELGIDKPIIFLESCDYKRSIPVFDKDGSAISPHSFLCCATNTYALEHFHQAVEACKRNKSLLRYISLDATAEIFQLFEDHDLALHFQTLFQQPFDLGNIKSGSEIKELYLHLLETEPSLTSQLMLDSKMGSERKRNVGVRLTTDDAHTLTDGPTLFLASDVLRVAKVMLKEAKIPADALDDLLRRIDSRTRFQEIIAEKSEKLENLIAKPDKDNNGGDMKVKHGKKDKKGGKDEALETRGSVIRLREEIETMESSCPKVELNEVFIPNKPLHLKKWAGERTSICRVPFSATIDEQTVTEIMGLQNVENIWKLLLLMGIGVFGGNDRRYLEIMKRLAVHQYLYLILADTDYIYGTNYQFCHGYLGKDLTENLTHQKMIQCLGRIGRANMTEEYTIRLRDQKQVELLFGVGLHKDNNVEAANMKMLFFPQ